MKHVLVSMTNLQQTAPTGLMLVDLEKETVDPVDLGWELGTERCTGIALAGEFVYALFESHLKWRIGVFDRDLKSLRTLAVPSVRDPHSIVVEGGEVYLVATGSDEVLRFELNERRLTEPTLFWRIGKGRQDEHHLNSLARYEGRLVVSGLGRKRGELWRTALDGFIRSIPDGASLAEGIEHPHSLAARGTMLAFCESQRKAVRVLGGPTVKFDGYTRGLAWLSDDALAVGESIGRRISKSTGQIANPTDPGQSTGRCGISVVDVRRGEYAWRVDLSAYGPEIYDVVALD